VRLVLSSLIVATLSTFLSPLVYYEVVNGLSSSDLRAYTWHVYVLPGITLALAAALGLTGVAGLLIIEWNRRPQSDRHILRWDGSRVAAATSILAGGVLIGSGLVAGLVYIAAFRVLAGIYVALLTTLAVSAGLFLFWTSGRIGPPSHWLRRIGLALGIGAAILSGASTAVSLLGWMPTDPTVGGIVWVVATTAGTLSLLAWIVVYGGILAKSGPTRGTPALFDEA
jgi:hypothetical protein